LGWHSDGQRPIREQHRLRAQCGIDGVERLLVHGEHVVKHVLEVLVR
jgi:hypothetical protein